MERRREKVLGYSVDIMTFDDALSYIIDRIAEGRGMQIVTINPEMIELASKNPEFSLILNHAGFVIPDGSGIVLALKLRGISQEQIPGIDFAKALLEGCTTMKYSAALIGAREEVLQTTVQRLRNEIDGIDICYARNGYFSPDKEQEVIEQLKENEPKLVLVALGAPKQELFIYKCMESLPNTVFIGVGGTFDVWAGAVERAPEFFRIMGIEWLYRVIRQPQRIKRIYKTLPVYLFKVIMESVKYNISHILKGKK